MHLLAQIRQNLRVIRERYGVARIGIFGSVVRSEATWCTTARVAGQRA